MLIFNLHHTWVSRLFFQNSIRQLRQWKPLGLVTVAHLPFVQEIGWSGWDKWGNISLVSTIWEQTDKGGRMGRIPLLFHVSTWVS